MHRALAKITKTFLGVEDHGIFTASLHVEYEGGGGQSIGGYALDEPIRVQGQPTRRVGTAYGMQWIASAIRACGAESWEDLRGRMIYVLRESEAYDGRVTGIQALGFGGVNSEKAPFIFAELVVD